MEIDWVIGIMVFLVFIGWAFAYYFAIFQQSDMQFEIAAGIERDKVLNFISASVYEAPVIYESGEAVSGAVLKAKSVWYSGEKNATKVFSGSEALPCRIDGDDLYWQADVASGTNVFAIAMADVNTTMNCTASFAITSSNLTVPWAFEKKTMASLARLQQMNGTAYGTFKDALGINQNFRIKIEKASGGMTYGKSIPSGPVNVHSKEFGREIFETSEQANITIYVWA